MLGGSNPYTLSFGVETSRTNPNKDHIRFAGLA